MSDDERGVRRPGASGPDPAPGRVGRRWAIVVWTLVAGGFGARALTVVRADWDWLISHVPDDALYYLEIGRHLGRGDGATFDGLNPTNGFHPLWQLAVTPATWVSDDDALTLKLVLVLGLVLGLLAMLIIGVVLTRLTGPGAAATAVLVALATEYAFNALTSGMETAIVLAALAALVAALAAHDRSRTARSAVATGLAGGVLVLARLDYGLPVLVIVGIALVARTRDRRTVSIWAATTGAVLAPYLAWALLSVGALLPVSGRIKLAFVDAYAEIEHGGRFSVGYLGEVASEAGRMGKELLIRAFTTVIGDGDALGRRVGHRLLIVPALVGVWATGRHGARWTSAGERLRTPERFALATVAAVIVVKAAIDVVLLPPWALSYAEPVAVLIALVVGVAAWRGAVAIGSRWGDRAMALALLGVLVLALPRPLGVEEGRTGPPDPTDLAQTVDAAADWVIADGPPGTYGAFDAGLLGFRLDRLVPVVNLDGLVNDPDHADRVVAGTSRPDLLLDSEVDVFVGRLSAEDLQAIDCATILWRPEGAPASTDPSAGAPSTDLVFVIADLAPCPRPNPSAVPWLRPRSAAGVAVAEGAAPVPLVVAGAVGPALIAERRRRRDPFEHGGRPVLARQATQASSQLGKVP